MGLALMPIVKTMVLPAGDISEYASVFLNPLIFHSLAYPKTKP